MDEKISKLFLPLLDKLYNQEPSGEPFRHPVDPVKYGCFDYYLYVKHPIDLSTIKHKVLTHQYKGDAWRVIADVQLMFSNAYLFNKKGTPVWEYTNKLSKIWYADLNSVMQRLNYCCCTLHKFGPQLLFCLGTTPDRYCQIAIGAKYKCYQDSFSFCLPCFNKINDESVSIQALTCETTRMKLPVRPVKKSDFIDCTNDHWQYESFIQCTQCAKRIHQICDLYPVSDGELSKCVQHEQIEQEHREQCRVPPEFEHFAKSDEVLSVPQPTTKTKNEPETTTPGSLEYVKRDKYVCNQCYRKGRLGFNLRHRKFSARRLPHTRMSRYLETKVNEYIRDNSPSAGEMTIRVLTAYRDKFEVKTEMKDYIERCKSKDPASHPNLEEYPDSFDFTTRAIFAWQEIDGVDVCVFGVHVQEYGEDCPEPNRQVVYLSYLDSVHFFRPKQFRTAVYHEILLSYFKYVKKLGFRRVFIWVCPSRKGDDYIFYRHPSEQKMPTLKRLSDWYIHLLDKGVLSGIVERHQNIYEYAMAENWSSILSMPYLSGDYWPGEFERLLKTMIESQKIYDEKFIQKQEESEKNYLAEPHDIDNFGQATSSANPYLSPYNNCSLGQHNILSLSSLYQKAATQAPKLRPINLKSSLLNTLSMKPANISLGCTNDGGDFNNISLDGSRFFGPFTSSSARSDDLPLDLSKTNSTASPKSLYDDDQASDASCVEINAKKRRRKSLASLGYSKKRGRATLGKSRLSQSCNDTSSKYLNDPHKNSRLKSSFHKDAGTTEPLMSPEEEMIKNLEKSLKRQKDGFIVVRLSECDCSPHFESQRRQEEVNFTCDLMKGREPFLQLARMKNYEFSSLRRAKFSSLAMVQHLGETFNLDPICNECFSFDSSKRHYGCPVCKDYYLCTSCHENTQHEHVMSLVSASIQPDIDDFLQQCSVASATSSISSASSTISNKSFNDTSLEIPLSIQSSYDALKKEFMNDTSIPLHRHLSNTVDASSSVPIFSRRQRNREIPFSRTRAEDEENSNVKPFPSGARLSLSSSVTPPPSHSANNTRSVHVELDQVLIENFVRHAELNYDIDFDEMKGESQKLLSHYWSCPIKDTCSRCKFVVLSCSFMSVLMRSSRLQMIINCPEDVSIPGNGGSNSGGNVAADGINLTTNRGFRSMK